MDTEIILKSACLVNKKDNWDIAGVIATCVSAFATFLACFIALWQTKYNNKKKIKLKFYDLAVPVLSNVSFDQYYISINITNIGNRKIKIIEWAYYIKKERNVLLVNDFPINQSNQLPKTLDIEESFDLYFPLKKFLKGLEATYKLGKINKFSKIIFGIKDSSGEIYYIKSPMRVYQYLEVLKKNGK